MSRIYKVTFVIIGTVIGAGFASGQEIYTFFNKYGLYGLFGLVFSLFILSFIIYKTLKISIEKDIDVYEEFVKCILPSVFKENKIIVFTISNIINIFLLISFNIMVSGFSAYFFQEFSIYRIIGGIIIAIISFIVFIKGIDGVVKINSYLIPIIFILIIILGIKRIDSFQISINSQSAYYWLISSILYASYNSICLVPILISLKRYINTKKEARLVSIFTFVIMLILSIVIFLLMNSHLENIFNIEIPIVYIASTLGNFGKYIYGICVLIAIFTTAVSSGYGFLKNVTNSQKMYLYLSFAICILSIIFSQISFSGLISTLYPIFGYLGILQIIFLLTA